MKFFTGTVGITSCSVVFVFFWFIIPSRPYPNLPTPHPPQVVKNQRNENFEHQNALVANDNVAVAAAAAVVVPAAAVVAASAPVVLVVVDPDIVDVEADFVLEPSIAMNANVANENVGHVRQQDRRRVDVGHVVAVGDVPVVDVVDHHVEILASRYGQ